MTDVPPFPKSAKPPAPESGERETRREGPGGRRRRVTRPKRSTPGASGKLRIGDNWNAITIIALSQNNPLKAIAEFVENSIDARAGSITIIRGKERGEAFLKIVDDGEGIPRDAQGVPDFKYVATHIGDSLKRRLKEKGIKGIQGEFGIGLLSFWTVGERMTLSSAGADGRSYQMEMRKNDPGYSITSGKGLFTHAGTELLIRPLLPGLRQLSGEKVQNYLASELRDRIRKSGVRIRILDRSAKKVLEVQPRQYAGRLLHEIGNIPSSRGEIYLELYLNTQGPENQVSLFRSGTRVVASMTEIDSFNVEPWSGGFFQGMIDAPFLQLTPGTRTGVIQDESFAALYEALETVRARLIEIIAMEKEADEEQASRNVLKSVQKAFKEAFLTLPPEDYQWFDLHTGAKKVGNAHGGPAGELSRDSMQGDGGLAAPGALLAQAADGTGGEDASERGFFTFPGPLFSAIIAPASVVMLVNSERGFRCIPRDKSRRVIESGVEIRWNLRQGEGRIAHDGSEIVTFTAPQEPGLAILEAAVTQDGVTAIAQSLITISETLLERESGPGGDSQGRGLPGYTFLRAPGELWRSRYDEKNNLVIINNGHRDYIYSAQRHARKLKYICRLFAKELVLANFPGFESSELLERVIELSLYAEEHLK